MKDNKKLEMVSPKTYAQVKKVLIGLAEEAYSTGLKGSEEKEPARPNVKWEKPDFHYSYTQPETFSLGSFLKWFKAADRYYRVALQYEAQQQNKQYVDRDIHSLVLRKYMYPMCAELLRYLKMVPKERIA